MKKHFFLLLVFVLTKQMAAQSNEFKWDEEFKFISEVVGFASKSKTSCLLKFLEAKNYVLISNDNLGYVPIQHKKLNIVVQFNQADIDFVITDHNLNMNWYNYESILEEIISFAGIPSIQFDRIVEEYKSTDAANDNFRVVNSGSNFIDVYTNDDKQTVRYERSELFQVEKPRYHRNDRGEIEAVTLRLLYSDRLDGGYSSLSFNVFRNKAAEAWFIAISAPLKQEKLKEPTSCSFGSESSERINRPYFNTNPLSFSSGYDLNPYDLESYLSVFYYDLYSNLPKYFGANFIEIVFKAMQYNRTTINFTDIKSEEILEPSNVLAIAKGMFDNCKVEIIVNKETWLKADNVRRLWIIYHELCHDILNLEHDCGLILMNPTIPVYIDETMFLQARDELVEYVYRNKLHTAPCDEEFIKLDRLLRFSASN